MAGNEEEQWGLVYSFYIDTPGYSDRDRLMFTCGVEFEMVCRQLEAGTRIERPIHRENESRIRMLCGRQRRKCEITQHVGYEGCETWSDLVIQPREFNNP